MSQTFPHRTWQVILVLSLVQRSIQKNTRCINWKRFAKQSITLLLILGGKEDAEIGKQLSALDPFKIYNACGKFNLNESADLVRRSKLIISNDTGLMHIAAAFKRPVVSLWGNTVPAFGMYPYYGENFLSRRQNTPFDVLEVNNLSCRPCSKIGYNKCPKGHFKCMENIAVEEVLQKTTARL